MLAIAYTKLYHTTTSPRELALALANKLKEATTPNPDEIHIVWSVEDVYEIAKEDGVTLTLEQAREVLKRCKKHHDACFGVSWETIGNHLTDVLEGR